MCGNRNYDGEPLDDRGRTTAEALTEDGTDAICERLDRLIELAEQEVQSRQETMRRMQGGVQEAVGAQNDLMTGLQAAIAFNEKTHATKRRMFEERLALLEGRITHIEELLENDARIQ